MSALSDRAPKLGHLHVLRAQLFTGVGEQLRNVADACDQLAGIERDAAIAFAYSGDMEAALAAGERAHDTATALMTALDGDLSSIADALTREIEQAETAAGEWAG